jgi:hypothetical protein
MASVQPPGGVGTPGPIADKFGLPPTFETAHKWTDTIAQSKETFGRGVWVRSEEGNWAHRKPGVGTAGGVEALREIVCATVAGWLAVPTPRMELIVHPTIGPCSLSYDLDGPIYRWYNVIQMRLTDGLFADGTLALQDYAGRAAVLDVLVGACDRANPGNHLYSEHERRWYTLDYGLSFNRPHPHRDGVGDPSVGYCTMGGQAVFQEIVKAIRFNPAPLGETLSIAEQITDTAIEGLLALPPAAFGDDGTRGDMVAFLKLRRSRIRALMRDWCNLVGLHGLVT